MQRPKLNKEYVFVRLIDGQVVDWVFFRAYADGSGGTRHKDGGILDGNWERDFAGLIESGYAEVSEAKRSGLLDAEWTPTD